MKNLAVQTIQSSKTLTMSSREIAHLIKKDHSNIKISAERLADKGVISTLAMQEFGHNGNLYTEYLLNKRDSLILVAQNCPEFTAAIVDRWQELESLSAPVGMLPDHTQEVKELESQLSLARRKKELADEYNTLVVSPVFAPATQHQIEDEFTINLLKDTTAKSFFNLEATAIRRKGNPFLLYTKRGGSRHAFRDCIERLVKKGQISRRQQALLSS